MKKTIQTNNLKPIDIDLHIKYLCPNTECGFVHWLSLRETKTKTFKVVCDCGQIFSPKTIRRIKIVYKKSVKNKPSAPRQSEDLPVEELISFDTLRTCKTTLDQYGFSPKESKQLIEKAYQHLKSNDAIGIIKYILQNLELLS